MGQEPQSDCTAGYNRKIDNGTYDTYNLAEDQAWQCTDPDPAYPYACGGIAACNPSYWIEELSPTQYKLWCCCC